VIDTGYGSAEILAAIQRQLAHGPHAKATIYGDGDAGTCIAEVLASEAPGIAKVIQY
jgi:hypothetical protein